MFALLNPRLWLALGLAAVLTFVGVFIYRAGKATVTNEWNLAKQVANAESRRIEQLRQSRADEAGAAASKRAGVLAADAARAGDALGRLRGAIAARSVAEESAAAATLRADSNGLLLIESATAYRELAATCDRHVSDLRLLLDAWPK